jgi:hypothetical protein
MKAEVLSVRVDFRPRAAMIAAKKIRARKVWAFSPLKNKGLSRRAG